MMALSGVRSSWLMLARNCDLFLLDDFKLLVEAPELLAHPVDVGRQRAQLVAIDDMDALGEVAGRDLVEPRFDLLDRPDQRPGDGIAERQRQHDAAERESDDDPTASLS